MSARTRVTGGAATGAGMALFSDEIQAWILASEGGFVDDPRDPGGATKFGITHRTLAAWRGKAVTRDDVRALGRDEALEILRRQYWDAVRGDDLPAGLDYAVFDYAVNSGPARAVKDLQRCVGVTVDGIIGAQTLAAIDERGDMPALIEILCARRWRFLQGLSTFRAFGTGWERRIWGASAGVQPAGDTGVVDRATGLALGRAEMPGHPLRAPGKAPPEPMAPLAALVQDAGGISGIGAAGATLLGTLADQPILQLGAVALIGVLVWRFVLVQGRVDPA